MDIRAVTGRQYQTRTSCNNGDVRQNNTILRGVSAQTEGRRVWHTHHHAATRSANTREGGVFPITPAPGSSLLRPRVFPEMPITDLPPCPEDTNLEGSLHPQILPRSPFIAQVLGRSCLTPSCLTWSRGCDHLPAVIHTAGCLPPGAPPGLWRKNTETPYLPLSTLLCVFA